MKMGQNISSNRQSSFSGSQGLCAKGSQQEVSSAESLNRMKSYHSNNNNSGEESNMSLEKRIAALEQELNCKNREIEALQDAIKVRDG